MTEWDKVDMFTCFEADPEIGDEALWYRYVAERAGYRLIVTIFPYEEDAHALLYGPGQQLPLTEAWLHGCAAIRYGREKETESLAFVSRDDNRFESAKRNQCGGFHLTVRPEFNLTITL